MAIAFPISSPTVGGIRSVKFTMVDVVGENESPYTLSQETYEHPGKRWEIDVSLAPMGRAVAEEWVAFLATLRGRRGTFLLGDPVGATPRGAATGTPLVKGASQTGGTLLTDGWTPNVSGILLPGDWFQLGSGSSSQLHKVLQKADSDVSGNATLEVWPGPRIAPADNAALTISGAKGVWKLKANERSYDIDVARVFGLSFSAKQAI